MKPEDSIKTIKGVGTEKEILLNKLGIYTIQGLLAYYPRDYEDRSVITPIGEVPKLYNERDRTLVIANLSIMATAFDTAEVLRTGSVIITKQRFRDDTGIIEAVWFNQPYMKSSIKKGTKYLLTGKPVMRLNRVVLESPEMERIGDGALLSGGRIVPIYPLTYKVTQKLLRTLIHMAMEGLDASGQSIRECLPTWMTQRYGLLDRQSALKNIHFPQSDELFFMARHRLVFEEFLLLQLSLLTVKHVVSGKRKGIVMNRVSEDALIRRFPFELTRAQKSVLEEMYEDMRSGYVMNRLVQGDVGSGKTAVAMVVCHMAISNGYQAALMAPTDVLANQHYGSFKSYFDKLGIRTAFLSGSQTKKVRNQHLSDIASGQAKMIIGTHAIIQSGVVFPKLGLVVTDEQHRFGVRQRMVLTEKGECPHVLVMTATPIPRTLALILYGDLDISIINELPPGRQEIDTIPSDERYRQRIYAFIQKEINAGRQVYVICPSIESEATELQSVMRHTESLNEVFGSEIVACLHGKMKPAEKQNIMDAFIANEKKLLVATTVIEVGVNVPNATVMLIENAERFGLAQLHQLRGRVGRGSDKSYCILMSESKNKVARERLETMKKTNDGFEISEIDLKLRGPGEFFGTQQHGLPMLKIANIYKDMKLLKMAQEAAAALLETDPELSREDHAVLRDMSGRWLDGDSFVQL